MNCDKILIQGSESMNIRKIVFSILLVIMAVFLIFVNIGLNISGPAQYNAKKDEEVLIQVKKRFPLIPSIYRHSFKYVTYSGIYENTACIFDYEGILVMKKDFDESMISDIQKLVFDNYGIENAEVHIGYGYDNMVFVVEEKDLVVYYDYDTYEIVYYLRGGLL